MIFLKKFSLSPLIFFCLFCIGSLFFACEGIESSKSEEAQNSSSGLTLDEGVIKDSDADQTQQSRGLDMTEARVSFVSLADNFPLLYEACKDDQELLRELETYAKRVVEGRLAKEGDILALFQQRDSSLIPFLTQVFENMDGDKLDQNWGGFQEELLRLGMTMTAAEGMFTSIGSAPYLEDKIKEIASEELKALIQFRNAQTESRNGEYPFQNMKPFRDMVLWGEKIMEGKNEEYKESINEDFQYALEAFTDVHVVSSPGEGTRSVDVALVGGISTDPYPSLAELETAKEFVASESTSTYKKALARILENPSEISEKPENIYVVVIEWAENKQLAQMRVRSHLRLGEDVPHYLKIRRGDGTDKYAISYRFYEDEEKANNAYDAAVKQFPDARLVFCSVKNGQLYQLGI